MIVPPALMSEESLREAIKPGVYRGRKIGKNKFRTQDMAHIWGNATLDPLRSIYVKNE